MLSRLGCVALALAVLALSPASAGAALQPSASVTLTDLGAERDGSHRVRIDWTGSCGPEAPADALHASSFAGLVHVPRRAGARPFRGDGGPPSSLSGSSEERVLPGRRVFARLALVCDDGESVARAEADSAQQLFVPPRLAGWSVDRGSYCNATRAEQRRGVGASDFQTLDWKLVFGRDSMLLSPSVKGMLDEVRLRASGKGLRFRDRPSSGALRKGNDFRATIFTPRSGRLTLWAEVGGVSTNKITIPIVGSPCVRSPKSYYGREVMRRANPFIRG